MLRNNRSVCHDWYSLRKTPFFKNLPLSIIFWYILLQWFHGSFFRGYERVDLYLSKFNFTNLPYNVVFIVINFDCGGKKIMTHLSIPSANKTEGIIQSQKIYLLWFKPLVSLALGSPGVNWLLLTHLRFWQLSASHQGCCFVYTQDYMFQST